MYGSNISTLFGDKSLLYPKCEHWSDMRQKMNKISSMSFTKEPGNKEEEIARVLIKNY